MCDSYTSFKDHLLNKTIFIFKTITISESIWGKINWSGFFSARSRVLLICVMVFLLFKDYVGVTPSTQEI